MNSCDKIIIGAGIFGLYSALYCCRKGQKVTILEFDNESFSRSSMNNQGRVHQGYHYPRSIETAENSKKYYRRFIKDFSFCINNNFESIYGISKSMSTTNSIQFETFCDNNNIKCEKMNGLKYLKDQVCSEAYLVEECSFDAIELRNYFLKELKKYSNFKIHYNSRIEKISKIGSAYKVEFNDQMALTSSFVLNATYASSNQILNKMNFENFDIKYELCEIILCRVSENFRKIGLTIMDGPFFSLMPYGNSGLHSLSAVSFTPHKVSNTILPSFNCQNKVVDCSPNQLSNCNTCSKQPESNWGFMLNLAEKYLCEEIEVVYEKSLFAVKAVLNSSENDDSRPTIIRQHSEYPFFISVLAGKVSSVYDLDKILDLS